VAGHLFTLEEARTHLEALREILPRIIEASREAEPLREQLMAAQRAAAGNGHVQDQDLASKRHRLEELAEVINKHVSDLNEKGIEIKDLGRGLVDFPSEREGRVVYLCWMYGEDDITYWHELDTGFPGRQPI
jgi:hypothetical protein